jgi:hypothetical protein
MATTLYCFTYINHGFVDVDKDGKPKVVKPDGNPVVTTVTMRAGDVFNATGFTEDEVAALIRAGALSKISPIVETVDSVTPEDAAAVVAASKTTDSK